MGVAVRSRKEGIATGDVTATIRGYARLMGGFALGFSLGIENGSLALDFVAYSIEAYRSSNPTRIVSSLLQFKKEKQISFTCLTPLSHLLHQQNRMHLTDLAPDQPNVPCRITSGSIMTFVTPESVLVPKLSNHRCGGCTVYHVVKLESFPCLLWKRRK
jgi:hypothetical protein